MNSDDRKQVMQRWIEALKILGPDPKASVACPQCGKGRLRVADTLNAGGGGERRLYCLICGASQTAQLFNQPGRS